MQRFNTLATNIFVYINDNKININARWSIMVPKLIVRKYHMFHFWYLNKNYFKLAIILILILIIIFCNIFFINCSNIL